MLRRGMNVPVTRRDFLGHLGAAAGASAFARQPAARPPARPNLLLVTTDYQSGRDGPSLGHTFLDMPAFNRICREGLVFERYYSSAPICIPSRYSLITGLYPHSHGAQDNQDAWVPDGSPILMEHLRSVGYHTIGVGKMHFSPWDRMAGFDRRVTADRKGNGMADNERRDDYAALLASRGMTRWSYLGRQAEADIFGAYHWPYDPALHIDAFVGDQAVRLVERGELREPWFLWVSFNGPHNPWDPPEEFTRPYLERELPEARTFPGELRTKPLDHTRLRYNYTRQVPDHIDRDPGRREAIVRRIRAGHYGGLSFIDRQLARLLHALEIGGVLDDTAVVCTSDHGSLLGDHDLFHKGVHYDLSARVPFVVRWPRAVQPGRTRAFAGHVDLMPTLLALAGAPIPRQVEGLDLSPILLGRAPSVRDHAIIEIRHSTAVVTDGWKMSVYPRDGDGDLYDLRADPDELDNRWNRPADREIRTELLERMTAANPALARELANGPSPPPPVRPRYSLRERETLPPAHAPYAGGRDLRLEARVRMPGGPAASGLLLTQLAPGDPHGYALHLQDGRAALLIRRWGQETVIRAPVPLADGVHAIAGRWGQDGALTLAINGAEVTRGRAPGGYPAQPGRAEAMPRPPLRAGGDDPLGSTHALPGRFEGRILETSVTLG